ncbi:long-chain fatty acid--CoA ligase [Kitasatospora sp. NPDC057015]|uniref:long-chain-fatty-acid--CoA ligase n=1 Tax=Kitasatospora sp. NPDC057015 TaxID=3346001 RepID=UPI0036437093
MTLSLACVLAEAARRYPDRTAVVDGPLHETYAALWAGALARGAGLRELGVGPGDRVALMVPNTVDFPRAYYAILAAGAVVVPVHLLLTPAEVAYVLKDSGARLLVVDRSLAGAGAEAAWLSSVPAVSVGVPADEARSGPPIAREDVPHPDPAWGGVLPRLEDAAAAAVPLTTYATRQPGDPAVILYTSGTTGRSKGAVLTQLNLVMNAVVNAFDANDVTADDVVLGCLPLFHAYGQTVAMNATFRVGATLVLMGRFRPERALELMVEHRATVFHGVPTMFLALTESAARHRPGPLALRMCVSGGAALPLAVLEAVEKHLGAPVFEGYGLSETSPTAAVNQPWFGRRAGTVGHRVWGVEVEIAAPDSTPLAFLPDGELGEIVIRGHNVFAGYHGLPEESAATVVDGWLRTGDLGTRDAEGFLTVVDRTKDVVIRGGFNVYPSEVEDVLMRHPAVGQVAVIGLPHPVHGEEVCAVVVPADPAAPPDPAAIISWAAERLGRHKYPRQVEIAESLPLGPSMKVLKRELRRTVTPASGT